MSSLRRLGALEAQLSQKSSAQLARQEVAGEAAPVRVLVTGAAGQLAYALVFNLASGQMLGPHQPVILHLLDIAPAMGALKGVVMELEDGAFPLVRGIVATDKVDEAFRGVQVACLVGAFPRKQGMERKDLLAKNKDIFKEQGAALGRFAARDVRVVVVGNPANTNALVALRHSSGLRPEQFSALTRLDHNRALAALAAKLDVDVAAVRNVVIWGNHSATLYPDASRIEYTDRAGRHVRGAAALPRDWLERDFIPEVQQRGAAIIKARKASSAASAARAVAEHVRAWMLGTAPGEIVSMAVVSDGSYGVEPGLVFSYPVTCSKGSYKIVQGLSLSDFDRQKIQLTMKELQEERSAALGE